MLSGGWLLRNATLKEWGLSLLPKDETGKRWSAEDANALLRAIKARIVDEHRAIEKGRGVDRRFLHRVVAVGVGDNKRMEADPEMVRLLIDGRTTRVRLRKAWAEICSRPRPVDETLAEYGLARVSDVTPKSLEQTLPAFISEAIERGIAAGLAAANGKTKSPSKKETEHHATA